MRKLWLALLVFLSFASIAHAQTYRVVYYFGHAGAGDPLSPIYSQIVQGRDGALYSVASQGGSLGDGAVFKITPSGTLTVLHSFIGGDGSRPVGGLTLGTAGFFYGTTSGGGSIDQGTIFRITPDGFFTILYSFEGGEDGAGPGSAPTLAIDGLLYGTTVDGGGGTTPGYGTVYALAPPAAYAKLHGFAPPGHPIAPLLQGIDGKLYGTAAGGPFFRITTQGEFKEILDVDGGDADAPLTESNKGIFFSTAMGGLAFKATSAGSLTSLHVFNTNDAPAGGLLLATDGNLYGTTQGTYPTTGDCGSIYRISPSAQFTTLYRLPDDQSMGCHPQVTLFQHTNGILYGDTAGDQDGHGSAFFSFDLGLPPFVRTLPEASRVGQTVGILGQGFTGTTAVSFNGTPAQFNVVSDTYLTAPVPSGATTGFVTVTTPSGSLTSNKKFQVRPQVTVFSPASGPVGTSIVITGVSLGGATRVTFGSTPATSFTQNSNTQVTAVVPGGAVTGKIGVTTTGAPSYSHTAFTVTQ